MIRIFVSGVLVLAGFAFGYSGGSGTQADPFRISDVNDIMELSGDTANYDKHFVLTNDIQMAGTFTTAVIAPIQNDLIDPAFEGVFDGRGFDIDGLCIDSTGTRNDSLGFFGGIGENGSIRNLGVTGINITGYNSAYKLGGMCGFNLGKIYNCHATGNIYIGKYSDSIGGLCGFNAGQISKSFADVSIKIANEVYGIGGLCGRNDYGTIESCYSITDIICKDDFSKNFSYYIGGLSGSNTGNILNCYAIGSIYGDHISDVGGLSGINFYGGIYKSYAAVSISYDEGSSFGGLCSRGALSQTYQCFWDADVCGIAYSAGGQPVSSADMMKSSTFADWDGGKWIIDEGNDYPHLAWESATGQPIVTEYPARTYTGDGVAHPFEIDSVEDIICMSKRIPDWDKRFVMTADVDMLSVTDYIPPTDFNGTFDGQGHIVSNLTIDANNVGNICNLGLFGIVMDEGVVRNLSVNDFEIIGSEDSVAIGGVCGLNYGSLINCNADGYIHSVEGWHFGLICGLNDGGISDCCSSGTLEGGGAVGGICGMNFEGNISNCQADAQVYALSGAGGICGSNGGIITDSNCIGNIYNRSEKDIGFWFDDGFGGLCGDNNWKIRNCYSFANVHNCDSTDHAGGFVGSNSYKGEISKCFSNGVVESSGPAGGFCGMNGSEAVISDCYSKGTLRSTGKTGGFCCFNSDTSEITNCYTAVSMEYTGSAGGFCYGNGRNAVITSCYWDKELSGVSTSDGGVGLTTFQMYYYYNYEGWDMGYESTDTWKPRIGSYPLLGWEYIVPGDVVGDYIVNLEDFSEFAYAWSESRYHQWCCPEFDFDNNGYIDLGDLMVICQNWLERR